jgi:hypothetical protein
MITSFNNALSELDRNTKEMIPGFYCNTSANCNLKKRGLTKSQEQNHKPNYSVVPSEKHEIEQRNRLAPAIKYHHRLSGNPVRWPIPA